MCASEGVGGSHDSQRRTLKAVVSTLPYCPSTINLSIQDPELARNQSFRFSAQSVHYRPISAILMLSGIVEPANKRR